jgi:hypothetical protein
VTINEDGLDCLSNDEVEKQYPIHIAYRSGHVMTLVEGDDGVARLITRDVIGTTPTPSLSLPPSSLSLLSSLPGAHVWTAIPIDVLPLHPAP